MPDTANTEEEDDQEEKSVLYDLWVLSPEWTDTSEPVNILFPFYFGFL